MGRYRYAKVAILIYLALYIDSGLITSGVIPSHMASFASGLLASICVGVLVVLFSIDTWLWVRGVVSGRDKTTVSRG